MSLPQWLRHGPEPNAVLPESRYGGRFWVRGGVPVRIEDMTNKELKTGCNVLAWSSRQEDRSLHLALLDEVVRRGLI